MSSMFNILSHKFNLQGNITYGELNHHKNKYLSNFFIKLLFFNKTVLYLHIEKQ